MRVERTEVVESFVCDFCGKEIDDRYYSYITMHGPASWSDQNTAVVFEWNTEGDYCRECCMKLQDAVIGSICVPDRYGKADHDAAIKNEFSLIKQAYEVVE